MALPTAGDRAAETSTTTGTGTYDLDGAITNWRTLVAACGDGATVHYFAVQEDGSAGFEVGSGVITDAATDTLTRATIYASSNAGAAVNWAAGTREIVVTLTANAYDQLLADEHIGVTVQAYDVDTAKLDVVQSFTAQQTFKEYAETQYSLTGTDIDPANGSLQYKTLSANTTFTESLVDGQSVTLMIDDGTAYTITWPTITWVGGAAPTLPTTGYAVIELWQINAVLYGMHSGDA